MKSIRSWVIGLVVIGGGWFVASLLCWPSLIGLQGLAARWLIPHPPGSYQSLRFISGARLEDFPASFTGIFSVPFQRFPLGFIVLFWYLALAVIVSSAYEEYRRLPRRHRAGGAIPSRKIVIQTLRRGLSVSLIGLGVCIPFMHQYEIVSSDHVYVRHLFDWYEHVYPLAALRTIAVDVPSGVHGRPITWVFEFDAGQKPSITSPDLTTIQYLLSTTHASSNFNIVGRKIVLR